MEEVKILEYNVLHGFHLSEKPFSLEKERLKKAKEIISDEDPDILAITEACYGGENPFDVHLNYKRVFGFPYAFFGKWGNFEWGNCLLSRYPLEAELVEFGNRTAIRGKVFLGNRVVRIDLIHPSPEISDNEKINLIKPFLKSRKGLYFLAGDFNSISDEDKYNRELLLEAFKKFERNPARSVNRLMKRRFIPYLREAGLKDTFSKSSRKPTIPSKMHMTDKNSSMRIDFIFSSPDVKVKKTKVIRNKLSDFASDHYPIAGTYRI